VGEQHHRATPGERLGEDRESVGGGWVHRREQPPLGAPIRGAAAAPAAIGAISENSDNFGKAMIFVALAEGVAIYGLLISILIIGKL